MQKTRVDVLLVDRGLIETREKAKRVVMAGLVYSNQERLDKPGMKVSSDIPLHIKGKLIPYVGRGGLKLEKALDFFEIDVQDKIMVDVGSSTGGFTDCALQKGAKLSYAIDVGYNQLDWKLRSDDRVIVMERTNFRYVTPEQIKYGTPEFASVDVSFISLRLILPVLKKILADQSDAVILIKPQFEAGRDQVGKRGVVRDKKVHFNVLREILTFAQNEGFQILNLTYSPITGGEGNVEFLAHLGWKHTLENKYYTDDELNQVIDEAHDTL